MSISDFLIFIHFTNQITLKPSLAQKLKLIFKFSTIIRQINIPLWTHMGHKGRRKDGKLFSVIPLLQNFEINLMPILFYYTSQVIAQ